LGGKPKQRRGDHWSVVNCADVTNEGDQDCSDCYDAPRLLQWTLVAVGHSNYLVLTTWRALPRAASPGGLVKRR